MPRPGQIATVQMQTEPRAADIAVIIVNYGTADLAVAAVESVLARAHGGRAVEVHLVDNASPGDDRERLQAACRNPAWKDAVTFYPETTNHGFGRGNNIALKALAERGSPPRYVFFLNPDAQLENEAIAILADNLDAHPQVAFAGAGIALPDGRPVTAAFRFPSIRSEAVASLSFGPVSRLFKASAVPLPPDHPEGEVDWVAGAAVLARFDVLSEIGFFDPVYFLYFEEVDLIRRARKKGHLCHYVPTARVIHVEGAATQVQANVQRARRKPSYWYESWRHYYLRNHGRVSATAAALAVMAGAMGDRALSRLRGRASVTPAYFFRDFWHHGLKPLLNLRTTRHD